MMMMILMLQLQLQLLLQLSSSNRPPRRLWSCNNDSGGGDALLGEHGKSRTHTHTQSSMERCIRARSVSCMQNVPMFDRCCCWLLWMLSSYFTSAMRQKPLFSTSTISR